MLVQTRRSSVLSKYPALKKFYQVPENVKSEADLVNTPSVKEAGDKFLGHYTDIAKSADGNVNATIQKKAAELNKQGMQAEHLKVRVLHHPLAISIRTCPCVDLRRESRAERHEGWQQQVDINRRSRLESLHRQRHEQAHGRNGQIAQTSVDVTQTPLCTLIFRQEI